MKGKTITSVIHLRVGKMLTSFNNIGSSGTSTVTTKFGFILFFVGLSKLKPVCDEAGQKGIELLINAAIVAILFDLIPLLCIFAGIKYFLPFVIQSYGLLELKKSQSIGTDGVAGISSLIVALIIWSILGLIHFDGDTINTQISLVALVVIIFIRLKIQQGIINRILGKG